METFSALLTLRVGNSPATGQFRSQRPVTRSFDVFLHLLNKQTWGRWFATPCRSLWRHCNAHSNQCAWNGRFEVCHHYSQGIQLRNCGNSRATSWQMTQSAMPSNYSCAKVCNITLTKWTEIQFVWWVAVPCIAESIYEIVSSSEK